MELTKSNKNSYICKKKAAFLGGFFYFFQNKFIYRAFYTIDKDRQIIFPIREKINNLMLDLFLGLGK